MSQCCHEKLRLKLFEKYYVDSFHFNTKSWTKEPTKTQINVSKNFYGIFNDLHQGLFCMLLPYKHTFFQAKHNSYYKRALLLQTLVQTAMEIFLSYFLSFDKKEKFAFLIPCNKRNL